MSSRTVYAVSQGEYSNYRVHCLFETRELAQGYLDALAANRQAVADKNGEEVSHWEDEYIQTFELWSDIPAVRMAVREYQWQGKIMQEWYEVGADGEPLA